MTSPKKAHVQPKYHMFNQAVLSKKLKLTWFFRVVFPAGAYLIVSNFSLTHLSFHLNIIQFLKYLLDKQDTKHLVLKYK